MFKFWFGNTFLIELILDIGNYTFFCLIFLYFNKQKLISNSLFLVLCLSLLTPFLFNNTLIPWHMNPDQSRYLSMANQFRENMSLDPFYSMNDQTGFKIIIPGYLFSLSPLLSIETFKSIGFLNRFYLLGSLTFFLKKKNFFYNFSNHFVKPISNLLFINIFKGSISIINYVVVSVLLSRR